jgi:type IV secretory pathway VirB10-like protein
MPWRVALSESEETKMAFSNSSYFAGVGTAFAAIAIGFAGGAMITNSAVQAPNRLERVTSGAPLPASAAVAEPTNVTTPRSPEQTASTADPQPVPQPQPASPTVAQSDAATPNAPQPTPVASSPPKGEDTTVNARQAPSTTPPVTAKSEDASGARNERASARSGESRREIYRKRTDDRKFTERRRRQDIDEAANAVRQMQREDIIDQVVERDEVPRSNNGPLRHFFVNDDEPRYRDEPPPRFGFFGND